MITFTQLHIGRPTHGLVVPTDNCCNICFPHRYGGDKFIDRFPPRDANSFDAVVASVAAAFGRTL
jgi:hypothetical protein